MNVDEMLDHFAIKGQRHGVRTRIAKLTGFKPQYISLICRNGVIPQLIQYQLEVLTDGVLKADKVEIPEEVCNRCGQVVKPESSE